MPKLFPIHIDVEELAVGKVMRLLHNMPGVAKVHLDFGIPKKANGEMPPPRAFNRPRKQFATTGEDDALKLLSKGAMATKVIRDHFADMGRSPASINSVLHALKQNGDAKLSDNGEWVLTKKAKDRLRHRKK